MNLIWILTAQTALILGLDLFLESRLNLWLLYFLPLLGTARTSSVRATQVFGILLPVLMLAGGLIKLGHAPWIEIIVPRILAVYPLALTGVLILRGKQFGARAMQAVSEAALQPGLSDDTESLRRDVELARQTLLQLSRQLNEAREAGDLSRVASIQLEFDKLLAALGERIQ